MDGNQYRHDATQLLQRVAEGDDLAQTELFDLLYRDLHLRAQGCMAGQNKQHTLQATALVNEAFIKLCGPRDQPWLDRHHFLTTAAQAMRHVLVDHARAKAALKRGEPGARVPLEGSVLIEFEERGHDLEGLDLALSKLEEFDPEMSQAVELRFFGGVSMKETAKILGIPKRTLERRWGATRAWLFEEIR